MKSHPISCIGHEVLLEDETAFHTNLQLFAPVLEHVRVDVFDDKEYIIDSGMPLDKLYLFVDGKAKITMLHEDGYSSIVFFVKPNDMLGELTLIGVEKLPKDVISIGQSVCLSVAMDAAREGLLKDPQFLLTMSRFIGNKLLDRTWFNAKQQHYELRHRLAAYILLCECDGIYNEKHIHTADYMAVSYRHLLHTIKEFKEAGILLKTKGGYTFDRNALEELASVME